MYKYLLFFFFLLLFFPLRSQPVFQWEARYDGSGGLTKEKQPSSTTPIPMPAMTVDDNGNVYITGSAETFPGGDYDLVVAKYNSSGILQWANTYNGTADTNDWGNAIALDTNGNVYVTGGSYTLAGYYDVVVLKYNSSGIQQWASVYDYAASGDEGYAITVDNNGNAYIAGYGYDVYGEDFLVLKYNSSGVFQWMKYKDGGAAIPDDVADAITLDANGNVVATGMTATGLFNPNGYTASYSPAGILQWSKSYNSSSTNWDWLFAIVADGAGNIFVCGEADGGYLTLKYDNTGTLIWQATYAAGYIDKAEAMGLDASGNVYVTGTADSNIVTIKYDNLGNQVWLETFNNGGYDEAWAMDVDPGGNVYVAGQTSNGTDDDYVVIKYNSGGVQQWMEIYNGPGNDFDQCYSIQLDGNGCFYIAGESTGSGTDRDIAITKYCETLVPAANFAANDTLICEGTCIDFTDLSVNSPDTWVWSFTGATPGTSTIQNPSNICYDSTGVFPVTLIVTNNFGSDTLTLVSYITVVPNPSADAGPDQTIYTGSSVQLNATVTSGSTVVWTPAGGLNDTSAEDPVASPDSTTTYYLTVTDSSGCTAGDYVTIFVIPPPDTLKKDVFLPTVFTPDKDGLNDYFTVFGINIDSYTIKIFNRWGQLLFSTKENTPGWDGTYKGNIQPEGVYVYSVKGKFIDKEEFSRAGAFCLLR